MKELYVFSTLASDVTYSKWRERKGDTVPSIERSVTIKGGAGVANSRIVTPRGVMTTITDADEAILRADPVFLLHEQNGYVTIEKSSGDADRVAVDMNQHDPSKPTTPDAVENMRNGVSESGEKSGKKRR